MESELGQDAWVLSNFTKPGFFLDVGSGDGVFASNTIGLEKHGWKGICIDAFPRNYEDRTAIVETACVSHAAGIEVKFLKSHFQEGLSGIIDNISDYNKMFITTRTHEFIKMKTLLLDDILEKHDAPKYIEYMSMDIEGGEYDVLRTFPFDKYSFGCITIEHNFLEPARTLIRELLQKNGYKFVKDVKYDDWYINASSLEG